MSAYPTINPLTVIGLIKATSALGSPFKVATTHVLERILILCTSGNECIVRDSSCLRDGIYLFGINGSRQQAILFNQIVDDHIET